MMGPSTLFEVRDAVAEHLGEAKARELDISIQSDLPLDAILVTCASREMSFGITRLAFERGTWREELCTHLDTIAAAEPKPAPSLPPLVPMPFDRSQAAVGATPCTVDEVRKASLAHLGPRAEALSFGEHPAANAVVVADPSSGRSFLVSAHTTAKGSWQGYLRECLDRLLPPSTASQDGIEQAATGQEPSQPLPSSNGS